MSSLAAENPSAPKPATAAIVGGGPAGLMAAETLALAGVRVTIFERMPSLARKFLMAGRGGLNITHDEPFESFLQRFGAAAPRQRPALETFSPQHMREWCANLGVETFVGSSGRVFPKALKASPLLRAWLRRLDAQGVNVALRHTFTGWSADGALRLRDASGANVEVRPEVTILAMGGASWPRLGAGGEWTAALAARGVAIAPLRPTNCGFDADVSQYVRAKFAGTPLKNIAFTFADERLRGECVLTAQGLEGGVIYALSAPMRDAIERSGEAVLNLDLKPDMDCGALAIKLAAPRGKNSLANHLRKRAGLAPVEIGLLRETNAPLDDPAALAAHIKSVPVRLTGVRPLARAISTAGGVSIEELDAHYMIRRLPGVFCAGEMLDWEAPTGGYLLQACFATGAAAARGALQYLAAAKGSVM